MAENPFSRRLSQLAPASGLQRQGSRRPDPYIEVYDPNERGRDGEYLSIFERKQQPSGKRAKNNNARVADRDCEFDTKRIMKMKREREREGGGGGGGW